jgi:photosystem II stability/assembly factor-like uncharacterized protein
MSVRDNTRGTARGERARVPWPLWRRCRLPWLVAALACVLMATLASLLLPLRPDPWQAEGSLASRDFWLAPIEANGFRRLPAFESSLLSVVLSPNGRTALAVGSGTILRSADSGANWLSVTSGTTENLRSVALAANGQAALAVGAGGTILHSADIGANWSAVTSGTTAILNSVVLSPDGKAALAVGANGTILRSADAGANWSPLNSGTKADLFSVALAADGRAALAVWSNGTILRSADGGANWLPATSGITEAPLSVALSADGQAALAVGASGSILRSADGGANWLPVTSGSRALLRSVALSADGRTALAVGPGGTILRSADRGANWSPATSGSTTYLSSVALSRDGKAALAVGQDGTILCSADGGANWSPATSGAKPSPFSVALSADGQTALAVGKDGTILRSADRGANWSPVTSGTAVFLTSVAMSSDDKAALAVGQKGTILRSADGGANWSPVASGTTENLNSVALSSDGRTALGGMDRTILRSVDGGANWSPAAQATPGDMGGPLSVALSSDGRAALGVAGGDILRSVDSGANWSLATLRATTYLSSVALSPDNRMALIGGFRSTILRSADGGATWSSVMPPHRAPPRIAWLLWTGGGLVLFPAFLALPPIKPPPKTIAQLLATDRPLRKGDQDATGQADELATQIGSFLRNAQTAPPLTLAITGSWGTGKSSVLSRLRDDLTAHRQRPVWFNAWHRQGEESMFAALMQAVRAQAVPSWWSLDGLDVRARLLLSRVRGNPVGWLLGLLLIASIMGFVASWPRPTLPQAITALHELLNKNGKLEEEVPKLLLGLSWPLAISVALLIVFVALRDRLSSAGLDPGRLMAAAGRATRWRDLGVQLAFRDRFKQALAEVTAALGRRTLTILIDDLDRCRPDQIAEVLEAINFLTDADGCFVAFGFARPQVLAGIGLANRDIAAELMAGEDTPEIRKAYAEDYLRKLIQIEVQVPRFNAPAAERLVDSAFEVAAEPRPVRAWLPALGGLFLLLWVGVGMWGGYNLYSMTEDAWNAATTVSIKSAIEAPPAKSGQPAPLPPLSGQAASPGEPNPSYFYRGESPSLPLWVLFVFIPALGLAVLAAVMEAHRPHATSDDDSKDFTTALHHWAVAAYEVRQSPREMKRFLNRLRFAAAGRPAYLPDDILVGLAVLHHAGMQAELACMIEKGVKVLFPAIDSRAVSSAVFVHIRDALDLEALERSGLPPFGPTSLQTKTFFALWEGVRVEA